MKRHKAQAENCSETKAVIVTKAEHSSKEHTV